ncbi:hypothetical protein BGI51_21680 [Pseudomonas oryzihabitans]|nr:hypothetical protein BGI51_21680 [Pseudomonas psychrotolerans]
MAAINQGREARAFFGMKADLLFSAGTCPQQGTYTGLYGEPRLGIEPLRVMFAVGHDHEGVHAMSLLPKYRAEQGLTESASTPVQPRGDRLKTAQPAQAIEAKICQQPLLAIKYTPPVAKAAVAQ